jgi:DNA mismatch repair protein MutS
LSLQKGEKGSDNETFSPSLNSKHKTAKDDFQLSFFQLNDPVLEQIKEEVQKTDINTLTPIEALMKLNEIKKLIGG